MRSTIIICVVSAFVLVVVIFLASEHVYPVAMVDGSLVWKKSWDRYLEGTTHALQLQAQSTNQRFELNTDTLDILKKSTFAAIVEDRIIAHAARTLIPHFDVISEQNIKTAIGTSTTVGKAAQFLYGFSEKDFHDFILLPESRREVVERALARENLHFDVWLSGAKKKANVHIFIRRYSWDGSEVK